MTDPEFDSAGGRRAYDRDVDPIIESHLERRLTEVRHQMREEFTVALVDLTNKVTELSQGIANSNLQAVIDHGEVKAKLSELERGLRDLQSLGRRVGLLEGHDLADDAVAAAIDKARTQTRNMALGLGGLIVAASGVILGNLPT